MKFFLYKICFAFKINIFLYQLQIYNNFKYSYYGIYH
jgi:hypothetical protein